MPFLCMFDYAIIHVSVIVRTKLRKSEVLEIRSEAVDEDTRKNRSSNYLFSNVTLSYYFV